MLKKKVALYVSVIILFVIGVSMIVLYKIGDRILEEAIRAEIGDWGIIEMPDDGPDLADAQGDKASSDAIESGKQADISGQAKTSAADAPQTPKSKAQTPEEEKPVKEKTGTPEAPADETRASETQEPEDTSPEAPTQEAPVPNVPVSQPPPETPAEIEPEGEKQPTKKDTADNAEKNTISDQKIKEVKDNVETADKMKAASLVLKRLSASDISALLKMAEGGVSQEEKKKAVELVYEKFTEDEIKEIKAMYAKYMK